MSAKLKDRHLFGTGVAACAVCCAPSLLALLGIAGAGLAATIATVAFAGLAFAGLAFGAVVLAASPLACGHAGTAATRQPRVRRMAR